MNISDIRKIREDNRGKDEAKSEKIIEGRMRRN